MSLIPLDVVRNYYESGELECEFFVNERNQKTGVQKRWYKNGQLFSEVHYRDGLIESTLREWYENGQLCLQAEMSKGEYHGHYQSWWEDGVPKEDGYFVLDKRQLGYCWYKPDGTLWSCYEE